MLSVFGIGEIPLSISGDPADTGSLVQTIRAVGAVSTALASAEPGSMIGVRGPFGTSWPVDVAAGTDVVIMAGGLGLAPLRPALYALLKERERYNRVTLMYGARSPDELLFADQLSRWKSRFDLDVSLTCDQGNESWRGSVGVVTELVRRADFAPENATAFVCGPEVMMRFGTTELIRHDVAPEAIYVSMERNMQCGIGLCGHCQFGPTFVCKDGPVYGWPTVGTLMSLREV